jgi:DUF2924 family protein
VVITTVTATWRRTTPRRASGLRRPLTKGFDWQGTIYSSLSAIARAITGTAWSGLPFFALGRENGAPTSQQEWKCAESRNGSYPASGLNTASVLDTAPHAIFVVTLVELTRRYHQSMISNCALNATLGLSTRHLLCRDERIDAVQSSPTFLKPMGEARLGIGHHKVGFSMKRPRLAVSNISDCSDVISIYDYQNAFGIKLVKTFSATDLGYDGSTPLKACDKRGKSA